MLKQSDKTRKKKPPPEPDDRTGWAKVKDWGLAHPFLIALGVFALVMVPVVWRLESAIGATENLAKSELAEEDLEDAQFAAEEELVRLEGCRGRNVAQDRTRAKFTALFDILTNLGATPDIIALLRAVNGTPEEEDRDCNNDGVISELDYPEGEAPIDLVENGPVVAQNPEPTTTVPLVSTPRVPARLRSTTTTTRPPTASPAPPPSSPTTTMYVVPPTTAPNALCELLRSTRRGIPLDIPLPLC